MWKHEDCKKDERLNECQNNQIFRKYFKNLVHVFQAVFASFFARCVFFARETLL